ncbi:MAG: hypothetical protein Kow0025_02280 [Thermodesulfovibrionales bacterium]
MENWVFLVAAYTIGWLGVSFYVLASARRQKAIEKKIEVLEALLGRRA